MKTLIFSSLSFNTSQLLLGDSSLESFRSNTTFSINPSFTWGIITMCATSPSSLILPVASWYFYTTRSEGLLITKVIEYGPLLQTSKFSSFNLCSISLVISMHLMAYSAFYSSLCVFSK